MTLPYKHRIRNLSPGSLRRSTLPLGHEAPHKIEYSRVSGEEIFCFFAWGSNSRSPAFKQAALTTAPGPPPAWRYSVPANMINWSNVVLILGPSLQRWPNINTTLHPLGYERVYLPLCTHSYPRERLGQCLQARCEILFSQLTPDCRRWTSNKTTLGQWPALAVTYHHDTSLIVAYLGLTRHRSECPVAGTLPDNHLMWNEYF